MVTDVPMQQVELVRQTSFQMPGPFERRAMLLKVIDAEDCLASVPATREAARARLRLRSGRRPQARAEANRWRPKN